jgi:4-hydroxy-4-methyl-2-oxoglutarate aldolase
MGPVGVSAPISLVESTDLVARFQRLPTAVITDVLRVAGLPHQALSYRIAPLQRGKPFAGVAFCARGETALGSAKLPTDARFELFRRIRPGSVLMVASGGYDEAVVFGENVALAAKVRGCSGIVADGGVRDVDALVALGIPIYCRFASPVSSAGRWNYVALDVPIAMPGQTTATVPVTPGDFVVGDSDGIIVVPAHAARTVAEDAEVIARLEIGLRDRLIAGEDPEAVYSSVNRFAHVRKVVP